MTPKRRLSGRTQDFIFEKIDLGWGGKQIRDEIEMEEQFSGEPIPDIRTIQRMVQDRTPKDPSGIWNIDGVEGEDARDILDVLRVVIILSKGTKTTFTQAEASWVLRIKRIAPDLGQLPIYFLAREYLRRTERNLPTEDLESHLAFAPWRQEPPELSEKYFVPYLNAVKRGWIKPSSFINRGMLEIVPGVRVATDAEMQELGLDVEKWKEED